MSSETKKRISETKKGTICSEETRKKLQKINAGENNNRAKITEYEARYILTIKTTAKNDRNKDFSLEEIGKYFNLSPKYVSRIMCKQTWKNNEPLSNEEYNKFKTKMRKELDEMKTKEK